MFTLQRTIGGLITKVKMNWPNYSWLFETQIFPFVVGRDGRHRESLIGYVKGKFKGVFKEITWRGPGQELIEER